MNDVNRSIKVYIDGTEAGKSIEGLRTYIAKLEKDLNGLNNQDPAYADNAAKMKKSIESAYNQLGKYQKSVQEVDRVLNNLSGSTYKELIAVQKKIEKDLKNTSRGTEEYNQKLEMHKKVSKEVALAQKEMRTELGSQASLWSRAKSWLTGSMIGFVSAAAAISGITSALAKYREERDRLESGQKELKALTGLDDESISWLTENAKRLSGTMTKEGVRITQSAEQILEAYRIVGGEKPELLDNKEALASVTEEVLILASASKMDLTEATRAVTLAMNQYSASAEEASRYTNVLAAGSKEGAAEVDSQAQAIKRAGVSAAAANIPIEQLVGTIQTLAEKGIKDEVAGTGLKKFFLTLQTGADDTNPKVVGLYAALDNLAKKQMEASDIKKMFGEEGYNVASVLINETEKVKAYTTAVTGTSVALEQAALNSDTAEARRAQRQNRLINQGISLLDKLAPSIEKVEEVSATAAETLIMVGEWVVKNSGYIAALGKGLLVYTALVKAYVIEEKIRLLITQATALATKGLHATLMKNPYALVAAVVITWLLAMREANKELNDMQRSQKLLNDVESRTSQSIAEQKVELESYLRIAKDDTKSKSERLAAIKKLNEISPEYLGNLTLEEIHTNKAKTSVDKYIESITNLARAQAAREKLVEIEKERLRIEMDPEAFMENISTIDKLEVGFMRMFSGGAADQAMQDMVLRGRKKRDALLADLQRDADQLKGIIDSTMPTGTTLTSNPDEPPTNGSGMTDDEIKTQKEKMDLMLQLLDNKHAEELVRLKKFKMDTNQSEASYNAELRKEELSHYAARSEVMEEFKKKVSDKKFLSDVNKMIADEENKVMDSQLKYKESIRKLLLESNPLDKEKAEYEERLQVVGLFGLEVESMTDEQKKALELLETQHNKNIIDINRNSDQEKKRIAKESFESEFKERKSELEVEYELEKSTIESLKSFSFVSENEIFKRESALHKKRIQNLKEEANVRRKNGLDTIDIQEQIKKEEIAFTQAQITEYNRRSEKLNSFAGEMGSMLGDYIAGNESALADMGVFMINLALDSLKKMLQIAAAQAMGFSLASPESVSTLGAAGIAKGLIMQALIEGVFSALKSAIGGTVKGSYKKTSSSSASSSSSDKKTGSRVTDGFSSGGYTGAGEMFDVAGVVHRGEYVVPAWQMSEPVSFNYVRALEGIRQTKQMEPSIPGYASGGMVDPSIPTAGNDMRPILTELIYLLRYLKEYGIDARLVYSQFVKVKETIEKSKKIGSKG